jgi:RNA:NAD 2'-phosphotransferase (TPT1/KptA family)
VPHKDLNSLIKALKKEWKSLDQETINKAVSQLPDRLKQCIDEDGGHG